MIYKWTIGKIKSEYRSMTEAMCTEREYSKWLDGLLTAEGETLPGHEKHVALVRRHAERYIVVKLSTVYGFMCGKIGAERTKAYDGLTIKQALKKKQAVKKTEADKELWKWLEGMMETAEADRRAMKEQIASISKPLQPDTELSKSLRRKYGNPEECLHAAIKYCAGLVCHVWSTGEHGGKRKSADYVFKKAQKGDSLFGECQCARELLEKWGFSLGTVQTKAARLHAAQSGTKHKKRDGMERPETMQQAAKKSRAKEDAEIRAEERAQREQKAKQGARQSGKKR